jgi:N-acetylmuramate 1-kinase
LAPTQPRQIAIELEDEAATVHFAEDLAVALRRGDLVALSGDLGAGKSTLARALIRAIADDPQLDVPSPTFTLVQNYPLRITVAHYDFYRLTDPGELSELGLDEALDDGVALVEWPERGGGMLPRTGLRLALAEGGSVDSRRLLITGEPDAMARLDRSLAIRAFLDAQGLVHAIRRHLQGDASSRSYELLRIAGERRPLVLMNAPEQPDGPPIRDGKPYSRIAHLAENVRPFVAIAKWLRGEGFAAPEILRSDLDQGILVIEHLGDVPFLSPDGLPVEDRYAVAIDVLVRLHGLTAPDTMPVADVETYRLPFFDRAAMLIEVELLVDWYLDYQRGYGPDAAEREDYLGLWNEAFDRLAADRHTIMLRDFHSPNLIWREDRVGDERLGIIDFQDAMIGPAAYDVASLVQDARVSVPADMRARLLDRYLEVAAAAGLTDEEAFKRDYAIMAAQRASKILGIFVRLDRRDRKPDYLKHLPRMRAYVTEALAHPDLTALRRWYQDRNLLESP